MKKYELLPGIVANQDEPLGFYVGAWGNETILEALQVLYQKLQDVGGREQ